MHKNRIIFKYTISIENLYCCSVTFKDYNRYEDSANCPDFQNHIWNNSNNKGSWIQKENHRYKVYRVFFIYIKIAKIVIFNYFIKNTPTLSIVM